ncbi:hypothetical protein [Mangrovibacterium diazotrophicum]|nr:hypothetical protein [Mangrovibacterium diazotrophicum]
MIERVIVTGEEKHRHYLIHEEIIEPWEGLSSKLDAQINGILNRFVIEFKMEFNYSSRLVVVYGKRQVDPHFSSCLDNHLFIAESTKINIANWESTMSNWYINKPTKINRFFMNIGKHTSELPFNTNFLVCSPLGQRKVSMPISENHLKAIDQVNGLQKISLKKRNMTIEYDRLIDPREFMKLLDLLSIRS